jgi:hypothetical protein
MMIRSFMLKIIDYKDLCTAHKPFPSLDGRGYRGG